MSKAFLPADILVPKKEYQKHWAVIACDQYTSEPEYWESVYSEVGGERSALSLILPEIYLTSADAEQRISNICRSMDEYLASDTFDEYKASYIYVERLQSDGILRCGLVGAVDLEQYDYSKGNTTPIRATEATVAERIPPRIKIREEASLELPHIMILIDDESGTVIEPVAEDKSDMKLLYDVALSHGAGSVRGWLVGSDRAAKIDKALSMLGEKEIFEKKYGVSGVPPLVYAMGDGNHSLATAKAYYESLKGKYPDKDFSNHPARYALAEIVNLHSEALKFEAIHRIVTGADKEKLLSQMKEALGLDETAHDENAQSFVICSGGSERTVFIGSPTAQMTVGSLQGFLDKYLSENDGQIDYIHGEDVLRRLAEQENAVGFILPTINKSTLFPTVIADGALVRKTFSMGHAADKRYYMEARRIKE